jgi:hypothetical protein
MRLMSKTNVSRRASCTIDSLTTRLFAILTAMLTHGAVTVTRTTGILVVWSYPPKGTPAAAA